MEEITMSTLLQSQMKYIVHNIIYILWKGKYNYKEIFHEQLLLALGVAPRYLLLNLGNICLTCMVKQG